MKQGDSMEQDKILQGDEAQTPLPDRARKAPKRSQHVASAHTPGPWRMAHEGSEITVIQQAGGNHFTVAHAVNLLERQANARLIAAAPALYEALRLMLADVEAYQANPNGHAPTSQIAAARAALAAVAQQEDQDGK